MKPIKQKIFHIHPVEMGPMIWQRSGGNFTFGDLKRALIGPIADVIRMNVVGLLMSDLYADFIIEEKDEIDDSPTLT